MSENKLVIDGKTIVLSEETVKNIKQVLEKEESLNVKDFELDEDVEFNDLILYDGEELLRIESLSNIGYDIEHFEPNEDKQVDLVELREYNLPEGYKFKIKNCTINGYKVLAMVKEEN